LKQSKSQKDKLDSLKSNKGKLKLIPEFFITLSHTPAIF
jgi:hypothetical protein